MVGWRSCEIQFWRPWEGIGTPPSWVSSAPGHDIISVVAAVFGHKAPSGPSAGVDAGKLEAQTKLAMAQPTRKEVTCPK